MRDWLAARARATPDKLALSAGDEMLKFAELNLRTGRYARWLLDKGVMPGEVVALLPEGRAEDVALIFAVMRLGAVLLPLNTRLSEAALRDALRASGAKLLLGNPERLSPFEDDVPCHSPELENLQGLEPMPDADLDPEATLCLMFTSGTGGQPRGVRLSVNNFYASAAASAFRLGLEPEDRWLCTLPLYHVGGLSILLRSCLYGTAVALQQGFDLGRVKVGLERGNLTLVSLVPTMLYRLLEAGLTPSPALRLILLGGASASPDLLARASYLPVATTYGLTEACSQVATALPERAHLKPGTVGKPLLFTEVKIMTEADTVALAGEIGEIWVRGPGVMQGYLGEGDGAALRDGWFCTRDLGYLDDEGDLFVVGRRKDLIISGGENIYPAEVERVLKAYSAVKEAVVVGLPDPEWGEVVAAALELYRPQDERELFGALERLVSKELAPFKRPRHYRVVETWPLTGSGKVMRERLKDLF